MLLFIVVLAVAVVAGGFAGGEIMGQTFSVLGAVIGFVGTATVLLGLGAYFAAQERKKPESLTPEMRKVFDRMVTGKQNPTAKEIEDAKNNYRT